MGFSYNTWASSWGTSWGGSWGTGEATTTVAGYYDDAVRKRKWTVKHEGKTLSFKTAKDAREFLESLETSQPKKAKKSQKRQEPSVVIEYRGVDISTQAVGDLSGLEALKKQEASRLLMAQISAQLRADEAALDDDITLLMMTVI